MYYRIVHGTACSGIDFWGGIKMEQGLQQVNQHSRLVEWGRRVEACRNSGQRVSEWCEEHGIPVSTYYSWQRKVFKAVSAENEVCFAEIPVRSIGADIAARIQCRELQVDIHAGADAETIQAIIRALKSC